MAAESWWRSEARRCWHGLRFIWYSVFFVAMLVNAYAFLSGQQVGPGYVEAVYGEPYRGQQQVIGLLEHRINDLSNEVWALRTRLLDTQYADALANGRVYHIQQGDSHELQTR